MTDLLSALREFRFLEDRRVGASLTETELARWGELRGLLGNRAPLLAPPPDFPAVPPPAAAVPPLVDVGDVEDVQGPVPSTEPPREPAPEPPPEPLALQSLPQPAGVPPPVPAPGPEPTGIQPALAARFPSLAALESEPTDVGTAELAEAAEPAQRGKTQPGLHLSELPLQEQLEALAWEPLTPAAPAISPDAAVSPEIPAEPAIPAAVSMAPVTLKGPVPPLVLDSPIAEAQPGDFDSPVTPIVFGEPVEAGAPISIAPVDAEAIVESVWRDAGEGGELAPPEPAAPSELGPLVAPIPLGSPIAPEVEVEAGEERGGIPLETVPYPAIRARLKPVKPAEEPLEPPEAPPLTRPQRAAKTLVVPPSELTPAAEAAPLPPTPAAEAAPHHAAPKPKRGVILLGPLPERGPEPATPEWVPSESLFENRPPPPVPILLQQPTAVPEPLDPALEPDDLPALEQPLAKEELFDTQSTGWIGEHTNEGAVLPGVVREAVLAQEPASGLVPGEHRVVVHTVAGPLKRGTLRDPDLDSDHADLLLPNGKVERIGVDLIRAIFFMLAPAERPPQPEGQRITVRFKDGRQLSGFCPDVRSGAAGFFLLPTDSRSNTARIYVFRSALRDIAEG